MKRQFRGAAFAAPFLIGPAAFAQSMPYTAPGSLTDEEAQQIAAYITSQPRPVFEAKTLDFLVEPRPPDAVYYNR